MHLICNIGSLSEASFDSFLREALTVLYQRRAAIKSRIGALEAVPHREPEPHVMSRKCRFKKK